MKPQLSRLPKTVKAEFETYNNKVQAIYLKFSGEKIASTKVIGKNCDAVIDLDKEGEIVGIEMTKPGLLKLVKHKFNLSPESAKIISSAECAFA